VWESVKEEYLVGQLSIAAISRTYGPSRQAIMKKAERLGWHRQLSDDVRNGIKKKTIEAELQEAITPENYSDAIDRYSEKGAGIVGAHKVLFTKILKQVDVTLMDLESAQGIMAKLMNADRVKKNLVMAASLALKERNTALKTVADVLAKVVPMQRQAFNMDGDGSAAEKITYYIVGDLDKPATAGMSQPKIAQKP